MVGLLSTRTMTGLGSMATTGTTTTTAMLSE